MEKNTTQEKGVDEVFCRSCGKIIKKEAEICPFCGVRQTNFPSSRRGKSKTTAVLLAIFLAPFNWVYTYKKDVVKFWIGLIFGLLFFWTFIVPIGIWIWAIIDTATKDTGWYEDF
ncbi:MAG: zinc ribbon domain-containing protein [Candidatus Nanoarchaeia archaeon]|nr:zinc ribbon domain-containing protein [Candidatus Nanoarchaeia archaeon]